MMSAKINTTSRKAKQMLLNRKCLYLILLVMCQVVLSLEKVEELEIDRNEILKDLEKIQLKRKEMSLVQEADFEEFEQFYQEILTKWKKKSKSSYAVLTEHICKHLKTNLSENEKGYHMARRLALSVLTDANELPIQLELRLINHIGRMTKRVNDANSHELESWQQERKEDAEAKIHAWGRLLMSIDPNWKQQLRPAHGFISQSLMDEFVEKKEPYISGMSGDSIRDPDLRLKYNKTIEANKLENKKHSQQFSLRTLLTVYSRSIERYLIFAYSSPPLDDRELLMLINRYGIDEKIKTRIIEKVRKRRGEDPYKEEYVEKH